MVCNISELEVFPSKFFKYTSESSRTFWWKMCLFLTALSKALKFAYFWKCFAISSPRGSTIQFSTGHLYLTLLGFPDVIGPLFNPEFGTLSLSFRMETYFSCLTSLGLVLILDFEFVFSLLFWSSLDSDRVLFLEGLFSEKIIQS